MMHDSLLNFHRVFEDVLFSFSPLVNFVITGKVYCTARAVSRAQHVAINACDWFSKFSSHQMREATCAASKTSKVPTRVALLFISYSMTQVNFPAYRRCNCGTGGNRQTIIHIIYVLSYHRHRRRYVAGTSQAYM